jgi:2,3-bisphosphoglycerate-dependent phosphoglycerate mutase
MERAQGGKIILVRHGETEANRRRHFAESDEIPLTETGRLQARQLALHLAREFRPAVLLSSCFLRARETSEIIAGSLDLETEVIAGIHERDFGCLRGHPYERMAEKMSLDSRYDPFQAWMWKPEGGESQEDVRVRAAAVLDSLRVAYAEQQVVVVCHGAVIQALCAHIAGSWDGANVPPNCGIVVLEHTAQGWTKTV